MLLCVSCFGAQSVTLAWDPSVDTNVTSYVLYWGTASGSYTFQTNVGNRTLATVSNMPPATWYFVVTARDDNSLLESDPSNEVFCTISNIVVIPPNPTPPKKLHPTDLMSMNLQSYRRCFLNSRIVNGNENAGSIPVGCAIFIGAFQTRAEQITFLPVSMLH